MTSPIILLPDLSRLYWQFFGRCFGLLAILTNESMVCVKVRTNDKSVLRSQGDDRVLVKGDAAVIKDHDTLKSTSKISRIYRITQGQIGNIYRFSEV